MKRVLPILAAALLLFSSNVNAQGTDYQIGNGTSYNSSYSHPTPYYDYYMGSRIQMLYRASDLLAAGMGPGFIYSIKWDVVSVPSYCTFYDWKMYIGTTTASSLSSTGWISGINTLVYDAGTNNPYNPGSGLHSYPLAQPFFWNGVDNIVVETCHGYSGRATNSWTENASVRYTNTSYTSYHYYQLDNSGSHCGETSTSSSYTGTYSSVPNVIFNWGPAGYNNMSANTIVSPTGRFCPGNYPVQLKIKNQGQNQVHNVKIYWELNGVLQPVINYNNTLDTFGGSGSNAATVSLGFVNFTGADHHIRAYTSMPNGVADTVNVDDTLDVMLGPSPKSAITPDGPTVFCTAGAINVTLNAPTGTGNFYQWFRDGQPISGATNDSYTATIAGDYTVRIDSNGCSNTSNVTRVDNLAMPLPIVHPSGYPVLCSGDSVTLVANAGITGASYQWQFQGADIIGATNASLVVTSPGNYTVVTTKYVCNSSSPGINVVPSAPPAPLIEEEANGTLKTSPNYVSYQWRIDGNDIPGATLYAYKPTKNGSYSVLVSNGGCDAESPAKIVSSVNVSSIYNNNSGIKIYPNPAHNHLYVDAPQRSNVYINTADGKNVLQTVATGNAIDISHLSEGIYLIKVTDDSNVLLSMEKLVIIH